MDLLDIAIIRDTRTSRHAKIPKVSFHDILAFKINNTFVHSLNNELKFLRNARWNSWRHLHDVCSTVRISCLCGSPTFQTTTWLFTGNTGHLGSPILVQLIAGERVVVEELQLLRYKILWKSLYLSSPIVNVYIRYYWWVVNMAGAFENHANADVNDKLELEAKRTTCANLLMFLLNISFWRTCRQCEWTHELCR